MLVKALMALGLLAMPAVAQDDWMSVDEMKSVFTGQAVTGFYVWRVVFSETYRHDGGTVYWDPVNGANEGRWHVSKQGFCTLYDNEMGGCFAVRRVSENCFEDYEVESQKTGPLKPGERKPYVCMFWLTSRPSTCQASVS
jgi:hypothetical protein